MELVNMNLIFLFRFIGAKLIINRDNFLWSYCLFFILSALVHSLRYIINFIPAYCIRGPYIFYCPWFRTIGEGVTSLNVISIFFNFSCFLMLLYYTNGLKSINLLLNSFANFKLDIWNGILVQIFFYLLISSI